MATLTDAQIAAYLRRAGFPQPAIATGVAIALAESGGRTDALNTANRNGSWDAGLMQINSIHGYSQAYLFDVTNNVNAALKIYLAAGARWTPWSTYNSRSYARFLPRGQIAANGLPSGNQPPIPGTPNPSTGTPETTPGNFSDLLLGGFWLRFGVFLLGGILLIVGLIALVKNTNVAQLTRKALNR